MSQRLNIEGLANEKKLYALGNTNFIIQTIHSPLSGWTVNIYDKEESALITGISLLSETRNLTWRYHAVAQGLFTGDLFLLKNTPNVGNLTYYNFSEGGDWCLYYLTQTEMVELGIDK